MPKNSPTAISSDFHGILVDAAKHVRANLAVADLGSYFYLEIRAEGRIQEGEVKLIYRLRNEAYNDNSVDVSGDSLAAVLDEYLRRSGWQQRHQPLALEAPKTEHRESF